jgi:hypothetical protein
VWCGRVCERHAQPKRRLGPPSYIRCTGRPRRCTQYTGGDEAAGATAVEAFMARQGAPAELRAEVLGIIAAIGGF